MENTISDGLISAKWRIINGKSYIQISEPISPGSSGGVLVNEKAEVIGITSAGIDEGQNLLIAFGWRYYTSSVDNGVSLMYYVRGNHLLAVGLSGQYVVIAGDIH